jgi:hypothetical protein
LKPYRVHGEKAEQGDTRPPAEEKHEGPEEYRHARQVSACL